MEGWGGANGTAPSHDYPPGAMTGPHLLLAMGAYLLPGPWVREFATRLATLMIEP